MRRRQTTRWCLVIGLAVLVGGAGLADAADPPAPGTPPPPPTPCAFTIEVSGDAQWITILPERQPPTRSRLSFDASGGNVDVEWDPYDGRGLLRQVVLRKGTWQVSFWAEPQRDSMKFERNYAWQPVPQTVCPASPFGDASTADYHLVELAGGGSSALVAAPVKLHLAGMPKRGLGDARGGPSGLELRPLVAGQLMRSFDVADIPARLAESAIRVIVRRVERKALEVASRELTAVVCRTRPDASKLFPRTCELVRALDLRALPAVADRIGGALTADVFTLARNGVVNAGVDAAVFDIAVSTAASLRQRRDVPLAEIQTRFLALVQAISAGATSREKCVARLALSVVAHCQSSSQCTASFIHDVIASPSTYYDTTGCTDISALAGPTIERVQAVIADGRLVFESAQTVTTALRTGAVLRTSLRLMEVLACDGSLQPACMEAQRLARVGTALADGDLGALLAAAMPIVESATAWTERERKMLSLFLQLVGQGIQLGSADPAQAQLAQQRVEAAFDLFLDGAADRDGRDGDVIIALASGLRVVAGVDGDGELKGPLSVPLGLSFDYLRENSKSHPGRIRGYHVELNALDLGNYLRLDGDGESEDLAWGDIASLSADAGYFWGDHEMPFLVGVTAGVAPGITTTDVMGVATTERRWVGFVAAHIGLYLPLIDLN